MEATSSSITTEFTAKPSIPTGPVIPEDFEIVDSHGWVRHDDILRRAAHHGQLNMAKLAVERGAQNYGVAAVDATRTGNVEILKFLHTKGIGSLSRVLETAAEYGELECFSLATSWETIKKIEMVTERSAVALNLNLSEVMDAASKITLTPTINIFLAASEGDSEESFKILKANVPTADQRVFHIEPVPTPTSMLALYYCDYYNAALNHAAYALNADSVQFLLDLGADNYAEAISHATSRATSSPEEEGNANLITDMITHHQLSSTNVV